MVKLALLILLVCGFLFNGRVFGQESFPQGSAKPMIEKVSSSKKKSRAHGKKRGPKKGPKKISKAA